MAGGVAVGGGVELEAGRELVAQAAAVGGLVVPGGLIVPGARGGHRLADGRGVPEAARRARERGLLVGEPGAGVAGGGRRAARRPSNS